MVAQHLRKAGEAAPMTIRPPTQLLGTWVTDPDDIASVRQYGPATLQFFEDGRLVYTIREGDRDQQMHLTYRIENGVLITNQPSRPREERTPYRVTADGKLVLSYEAHESVYVRTSPISVGST